MSSNVFGSNETVVEKNLGQSNDYQSKSKASSILAPETPPLDFDEPSYRPEYSSPIPPNTIREKNVRDHLIIISENLLEIQESLNEITKITGIKL